MDIFDDDNYPDEFEENLQKNKGKKTPDTRRKLVEIDPKTKGFRDFILYECFICGLCIIIACFAFINRVERKRLHSSQESLKQNMERLMEESSKLPSEMQTDPRLVIQIEKVIDDLQNLEKQIADKGKFPHLFFIIIASGIILALYKSYKIYSSMRNIQKLSTQMGVGVVVTSFCAIVFNISFIYYFFTFHLWFFIISFLTLTFCMILILSPKVILIFDTGGIEPAKKKVQTLEELQEKLPDEDYEQ